MEQNRFLSAKMSAVLTILCLLCGAASGIDVGPSMRSFSSAIKGGSLAANAEKVLYEHSTGEPGVITEQWFTGRILETLGTQCI